MDYVYLMLSMLTRYTTGLVYSITQRDFCQAMLKIKAALTMIKKQLLYSPCTLTEIIEEITSKNNCKKFN